MVWLPSWGCISMSLTSFITQLGAAGGGLDLDYYWFDVYGDASGNSITDVKVDSQGNSVEYYYNTDFYGAFLTKREPDGTVLWQKKILQSYFGNQAPEAAKIAFDGNDDIILAFRVDQNGNSPGMTLHSGTDGSLSDGPVFINAQSGSGGIDGTPVFPEKLSNGNYLSACSSQVHTFNSTLDGIVSVGRGINSGNVIGKDSSGNIVMYRSSAGGTISGQYYFWLVGFNPITGSKAYERRIQHTGLNFGISKYLSNGTDTYLVGYQQVSGSYVALVCKLSAEGSSAAISWARYFTAVSFVDAAMLSTGEVIVLGHSTSFTASSGYASVNIINMSTSGSVNYWDSFGPASGNTQRVQPSSGMGQDENDNLYIPCYQAGVNNKVGMLKIPGATGAVTQTLLSGDTGLSGNLYYYHSYTYSPGNQSGGASANTSVNAIQNKSASTGSYGSINVSASSYTHTQVDITT